MFKKFLVLFVVVFGSASVFAQSGMKPEEMLKKLPEAAKAAGLQVGMIVDAHEKGVPLVAKIVTLSAGKNTAYDALENSGVTRVYHPQYSEPPKVLVIGLAGEGADRTEDGDRSWAFFVASKSGAEWKLANLGIGEMTVSDGSVIGFSRTAWVKKGDSYTAKDEPRTSSK